MQYKSMFFQSQKHVCSLSGTPSGLAMTQPLGHCGSEGLCNFGMCLSRFAMANFAGSGLEILRTSLSSLRGLDDGPIEGPPH